MLSGLQWGLSHPKMLHKGLRRAMRGTGICGKKFKQNYEMFEPSSKHVMCLVSGSGVKSVESSNSGTKIPVCSVRCENVSGIYE